MENKDSVKLCELRTFIKKLECNKLLLVDGDNCSSVIDYFLKQNNRHSMPNDYFIFTLMNTKSIIPSIKDAADHKWFSYCKTADSSPEATDHLITIVASMVLEYIPNVHVFIISNDKFVQGVIKNLRAICENGRIGLMRSREISKLFKNLENDQLSGDDEINNEKNK